MSRIGGKPPSGSNEKVKQNMDKMYIENQYKLAWLDFKTAHNEGEQWDARKRMARLEALASELYGFDYADSLQSVARSRVSES